MLWFDTFKFVIPVDTTPREYPPIALTSDSTVISGQSYGNGTYTLSSTTHDAANAPRRALFDKNAATFWTVGNNNYNTSGIYQGPTTGVYVVPGIGTGDWMRIDLPQAITLTSYSIQARQLNNAEGQSPSTWIVAGWNGTSWVILDNSNIAKTQWVGTTTAGEIVTRPVTTSDSYSSYIFFSNRVTNVPATYETLTLAEWRLYGYQ